MIIRPVGAELLHADRQTDMTKIKIAFRNSANAPNDVSHCEATENMDPPADRPFHWNTCTPPTSKKIAQNLSMTAAEITFTLKLLEDAVSTARIMYRHHGLKHHEW
jgi:hypothetical protein